MEVKKLKYFNLSGGIGKFSSLECKLFSHSVNTSEEKLKIAFWGSCDVLDDSIPKLKNFWEWIRCWFFSLLSFLFKDKQQTSV